MKWQGYDPYSHAYSPVYATQAQAQLWENAQWAQDQQNGITAGDYPPGGGAPYEPPAPPTQVVTATVTVGSTVDVYSLTVAYSQQLRRGGQQRIAKRQPDLDRRAVRIQQQLHDALGCGLVRRRRVERRVTAN